ncbi:MAG: RNA pseudouridine synthase [Saccharospirillum sp.]|uniref:pseudouridine synthase n=1 Tax=Saccharospirillum sp. TaxID=2033801 RepID=UPI0034A055EE
MRIDVVLEVDATDSLIAIDFLVDNIELSKSRLKDMMNKGAVWHVDAKEHRQRLRRAMTDLKIGDRLEVFYDEDMLSLRPPLPRLVQDLTHYSVWDKGPGLLIEGTDWGDHASLIRLVELYFKPRRDVFVVQRLDSAASGLVIVAHSRKAAALLTEVFDTPNAVTQQFRVEVAGDAPEEGVIETPLDGKPALTQFRKQRYEAHPNRSILDVWPKTRNKHQIRRHLDSVGHPVMGDPRYGKNNESHENLKLKAVEMRFDCPITKETQVFSLL